MRSFWKTDYEAYEQLVALGNSTVTCIKEYMNGSLKTDTIYILEMVLEDLGG